MGRGRWLDHDFRQAGISVCQAGRILAGLELAALPDAELGAMMAGWKFRDMLTSGSIRCATASPVFSTRSQAPALPSQHGAMAAGWSICGAVTPTPDGGGRGTPPAWSSPTRSASHLQQCAPCAWWRPGGSTWTCRCSSIGLHSDPRLRYVTYCHIRPGWSCWTSRCQPASSTTGRTSATCWQHRNRRGNPVPRTENLRCSMGTWSVNWCAG